MSNPASFASPESLEQAFYDALTKGDADLLMQLWAEDEETLCVHPTGVRLVGIAPIRESWRSIFSSTRLRVEAKTIAHWRGSVIAIHLHGPLHVTHVYARGAHGWRLVSRHASAADDSHQAMAEAVPHTLH